MKIDQKAISLALGTVSVIVSFVCIVLIAVLPVQTMNFFGWLIHIDNLADIVGPRNVNLGNAVAGLITSFVLGYVIGWLFAVLYNKFTKSSQE